MHHFVSDDRTGQSKNLARYQLFFVDSRLSNCSLRNLVVFKVQIEMAIQLVFPRDGTSRGTSRDKPGRDVPLSLCPGTKKNSCPGVPLSRDKGRSKCPGTNSSVPGRPGKKRIKKFQRLIQILSKVKESYDFLVKNNHFISLISNSC